MRVRRRRFLQTSTAVTAAAALGLVGPAGVFAQTSPLPGGGTVSVTLDQPAAAAAYLLGEEVLVSGSARVDADPTPTRQTALVYTVDVSGSTTSSVSGGPTNCGDQDLSGSSGTVLDCELRSLLNLNTSAITGNGIGEVAAVAFAGRGVAPDYDGRMDAVVGDVDPTSLDAVFTEPGFRTAASGEPDIVQVLRSASNDPTPGFGLARFTPRFTTGALTNFEAAVERSVATANASTLPSKLVVMLSDGIANEGIGGLTSFGASADGQFADRTRFRDWVEAVAGDVRFITFAVGSSASCSAYNGYGSLQLIAEATGGTCSLVTNPATLPDVLPRVIETALAGISVRVDGVGVPATATGLPADPGVDVPFTAAVTGLAPGQHEVCATATGRTSSGTGDARECRTVDVRAVTVPTTLGGRATDVEGVWTPIAAEVAPGATFAGWGYSRVLTDSGATCEFQSEGSPATLVRCTDDGLFDLHASTVPNDTRTTRLTLGNLAPVVQAPVFEVTGPVFTGGTVPVSAPFTDRGENDSHTCEVDAAGSTTPGTVLGGPGGGTCRALVPVTTAGTFPATARVTDDDGDTGEATSDADGSLEVVDLVITADGTNPDGSLSGVEGTPVVPEVSVPAGTTLSWAIVPSGLDAGAACTLSGATTASPSVLCDDDGLVRLSVTATLNGRSATRSVDLVVANADPVLEVPVFSTPGPVVPGTPVTVVAGFDDAGANDTHTCADAVWNDGATSPSSLVSGHCRTTRSLPPSVTPYTVEMAVADDDLGTHSRSSSERPGGTITVTAVEIAPGGGQGGAYRSTEGTPVTISATAPDGAALAWAVAPDSGVDAGAACTVQDDGTTSPSISCDDDGRFLVTVTATVGGYSQSAQVPLEVANAAPVVGTPVLTPALAAVGSPVSVSAPYADAGAHDAHSCSVDWGDGTAATPGTVSGGRCSATRPAAVVGVSTVTVTVTDDDAAPGSAESDYLVVYDPNGGFVTGGGHVSVPAGSLTTDPSAAGKASFGFNSKYKKGATVPTGNTEFQFHAGNLNVASTDYQWLVVSGAKAQFRGTCTVNGVGGHTFQVTALDGQARGSGSGTDAFRIKVWDSAGGVLFDNQTGSGDDFASSTGQALSGGSIVIHSAK
jgi:hypothetical protein